ncbi:MAG: Hpt domain-containing protein [Gammaproteobacteria bacterium]|nr:Hpt domain-containing protein [Gammaproteobacteria bacterium]NNM21882.1 response regulator [Gammaproteobacteria bacterium]
MSVQVCDTAEGLRWIGAELTASLREARAGLERFVEAPEQREPLAEVSAELHKVHGALRLVEVHGAAQLAEEMVYVATALYEESIKDSREGLDALSRAMVQMPTYLDRVQNGGRDIPLVLLPLLNDLRAVRGSPLLSENTLFILNMDSGGEPVGKPEPSGEDVVAVAKKLRPRYQATLLGWLRGEHIDSNLATMGAIAENIQQAASSEALYQLFWVAGAITETLRDDGLDSSVAVKRLLGQSDRCLKRLIDEGEASFNVDPPSQLINNLLYYAARANSNGPLITEVKQSFSLAEVLPGADQVEAARSSLAAPSTHLMETVGAAIRQDLGQVKDVLDIYVRTGKKDMADLAAQNDTLKRIADTLAMLGLGDLRAAVLAERDRIAQWVSGETQVADDEMMASAAVLLSIEDGLDHELLDLVRPDPVVRDDDDATDDSQSLRESDFRAVARAVIRECLVNLSRVKESISQFAAANTQALDNVADLLRAINAGLLMLGKTRAVSVIDRVADYTRGELRGSEPEDVTDDHLDRLADAIVSVEYYLDSLHKDRGDPWYMLDNADACLDVIAPAGREAAVEIETPAAEPEPAPAATPAQTEPVVIDSDSIDPELLETFIDEAREEIFAIRKNLPVWIESQDEEPIVLLRRSYHTLKGSGRMVGAQRIGEFAWALEDLCNRVLNGTVPASTGVIQVMQDAADTLPSLLEQLEVGTEPQGDVEGIANRAQALARGEEPAAAVQPPVTPAAPVAPEAPARGMDPVLYEIFRNETDVHLQAIDAFLTDAAEAGGPCPATDTLQRAWHTLSGSANMAGARDVAAIADPVNKYIRGVHDEDSQMPEEALAVLGDAVSTIRAIVETINEDAPAPDTTALAERIAALEVADEPASEQVAAHVAAPPVDEGADEIASIFGDEATQILEAADISFQGLGQAATNRVAISELQRQLHTLKGGARMAGVSPIGDLSHELESLLIAVEGGRVETDGRVLGVVQESLDRMHAMADALRGRREVREADDLLERIHALAAPVAAPAAEQFARPPEPEPEPAEPVAAAPPPEPELPAEEPAESDEQLSAAKELFTDESGERREFARVSAELLDDLLNNVGEVSIYHSRLEQQISTIGFNTAELAQTVTRLREQLRKLEMETEAHILHKHHDDTETRTDFDPLEMDRYSLIQQLSRALAESVSDLSSIQGLLEELTRDAETLLVQQSRVTTELQDGLMRTRMIPFQRHVPRFSRLVRQIAGETGKRAELKVDGGGELDRQVLERMLPPFEHMLRNAVVHGIEPVDERERMGKPAVGTIDISLAREGSEMIIVFRDDGRGLDVDRIRERASAQGLINRSAALSDSEILQLVLEPGFSTATEVTQAAGRGVGMDIVANVVKQLGGSLDIASTPGQGATFTVRLPLTLAISQALLVRTHEELYAIPVPTLAGVARLPVGELREYLEASEPQLEYGDHLYRFQHLGHLLGGHGTDLDGAGSSVPLVLVRAGEHSTALIADEIVGSREIVVKPVGPQIAAVRGVAGATILGDGSIVVILDVNALVRSARPARVLQEPPPQPRDERPAVLVVDDSITVRRVTQRLLERNDMRVTTAKDGVDAVAAMQEFLPDLILLDIEMPRMDGYEVATHVRNSPRLQGVPIVMVTSRVGDKHRNRAIEIGVNAYLGKPYQEAQLLEAIRPLLAQRAAVS